MQQHQREVADAYDRGHAEALGEIRALIGEAARHGHTLGWLLDRVAELEQPGAGRDPGT